MTALFTTFANRLPWIRRAISVQRLVFFVLGMTLLLSSCGTDSHHFKIEGRLLNMNQGELYVYSLEGERAQIDTMAVNGGRFAYEVSCEVPQTFMLVFPNFSEQPIFAQPGQSVSIKADASHLKDIEVKGGADNQLMNQFRKQTLNVSPPEEARLAKMFIADHPKSPASVYLLRRYFVQNAQPDYNAAIAMCAKLLEQQPRNGQLINLQRATQELAHSQLNASLPAFSLSALGGTNVSRAHFSGRVGVIYTWATWNYEGQAAQRELRRLQRRHGSQRLALLGVCLDPATTDCRRTLQRDTINWPTVCDGQMFHGDALRQLGLRGVPDNIVIDSKGRIVAHGLDTNQLLERLKELL
jgi:hypothetical protein